MKIQDLIIAVLGAILKVVIAVAIVNAIYRGAMMSYDFGYRILTEPAMSVGEGRPVKVTVTSDMSPLDLGKLMEENGLSRDGRLFALQYLFSEYREDMKPGTYELSTAMTAEEIMAQMVPKPASETEPIEEPEPEDIAIPLDEPEYDFEPGEADE